MADGRGGPDLSAVLGRIPFRMALAGGWIDQPFMSRVNPAGVGSMVVVGVEPDLPILRRAGIATGTREVAMKLWGGVLPDRPREQLVRELYEAENRGRPEPSGSQDMIGLIYPGVSRLDYSFDHAGGVFPKHVETCADVDVARWLEKVIQVIAVGPRPAGYGPLGVQNIVPAVVQRLGESGRACFDAIVRKDLTALGASMNACTWCWDELLPHVLRHPLMEYDMVGLVKAYQKRYPGAMFSGCGGGYLYVVSDEPVPGAFGFKVRV